MIANTGSKRQVIWEGSGSILPDRVRYRLVKMGGKKYLEIEDSGRKLSPIIIPPDRKRLDLPLWMTSILAWKIKDAPKDRLDAMESEIRRLLVGTEKTITICMGPRREARRAAIFHLAWKGPLTGQELKFVRKGNQITIKGEMANPIVASDPDHLIWEFSLIAKSEEDAIDIETEYKSDPVLCFDDGLAAILAVSAEHWEAIGLAESQIRGIAEKKSLRLVPLRKRGKLGFSFLALPIAGVSH